MMAFNQAGFQSAFRDMLVKNVAELFDVSLKLMEQEFKDGWRCYHARELWFKENLPAPLLNDLGRRYMCEKLLVDIYDDPQHVHYSHPGQTTSRHPSAFLQEFSTCAERRAGYRNFLDVGILDAEADEYRLAAPYDLIANEAMSDLLKENRHHLREIADIQYVGRYVLHRWPTRTPPYHVFGRDKVAAVRNAALPLAQDRRYWEAVYSREWAFLGEMGALHSTKWPLMLMAELAPEFPYSAALSTRTRMVFMQEGSAPVAWAIIVQKIAGDTEYFFPPPLMLCARGSTRKFRNDDTLFNNPVKLDWQTMTDSAPRDVELNLLYLLPRYRSLIAFYAPFVAASLAAV